MEGALSDDKDVIEAMYPDEVCFGDVESEEKEGVLVELKGTPHDQQEHAPFQLRLDLSLRIKDYPIAKPCFTIQSSRGLSDRDLRRCMSVLSSCVDDCKEIEEPYLLPLIEALRDFLDEVQDRGGECSICWESGADKPGVSGGCYHYFHTSCLSRWVWTKKEEAKTKAETDGVKAAENRAAMKIKEASDAVNELEDLAAKHERAAYLASIKMNQAKEAIGSCPADDVAEHKLALERATVLHRKEERSASTANHKLKQAQAKLAKTQASYAGQLSKGAEAVDAPTPCPVCRAPIPQATLAPFYAAETKGMGSGTPVDDTGADAGTVTLDGDVRAYVDRFTAEVKRVLEHQKEVGGLIEDTEPLLGGGGGGAAIIAV